MMARTHLHEFLREDQEPFHLKNYIADRRSQLKLTETTTTTTAAAVTKRKPINERNAVVFLNFPTRTSALKQSSFSSKSKPQSSKNVGFGLLGSFLKRFKYKSNRTKRHEIEISSLNNTKSSIPATRRFRGKEAENDVVISLDDNGSGYRRSRVSSSDWSEKSSESETYSCSSILGQESYEIQSVGLAPENHVSSSFAMCPSLGHRTPDFLSPATSPSRRFRQDKENNDVEQSKEINVEDEEQCSPVSVLDRPFEDHEHEYNVVGGDAYDLERSYANLQRTKHQLLQKLARFERLVELDPIALEKHMVEECDDDDNDDYQGVVINDVEKEVTAREEFLRGIIVHLGVEKIPLHVERLVLDLISEENKNEEHEAVLKKVCWRLDSWKLVESNTIDMMVELELRREKSEGWKRHDLEMVKEIAMSIEVAIMGVLVEEFVEELADFFVYQSSRTRYMFLEHMDVCYMRSHCRSRCKVHTLVFCMVWVMGLAKMLLSLWTHKP